jgi:hypothetical protein
LRALRRKPEPDAAIAPLQVEDHHPAAQAHGLGLLVGARTFRDGENAIGEGGRGDTGNGGACALEDLPARNRHGHTSPPPASRPSGYVMQMLESPPLPK